MICIEPCHEVSKDLFLYSCKCVYPIHSQCFKDWRREANTNRVCLICQECLEPHNRGRGRPLLPINPGIDGTLDEHTEKIYRGIMFCITFAILMIGYLLFKHALRLLPASSS